MTALDEKPAHLDEHLTVIFTPQIGERMRQVRMKWLVDQRDMAKEFGITQQHYSRLERGQIRFFDVTLKRFKEIYEDAVLFVLRGTGAGKWEVTEAEKKKWLEKKYAKQLGAKTTGAFVRGIGGRK